MKTAPKPIQWFLKISNAWAITMPWRTVAPGAKIIQTPETVSP